MNRPLLSVRLSSTDEGMISSLSLLTTEKSISVLLDLDFLIEGDSKIDLSVSSSSIKISEVFFPVSLGSRIDTQES